MAGGVPPERGRTCTFRRVFLHCDSRMSIPTAGNPCRLATRSTLPRPTKGLTMALLHDFSLIKLTATSTAFGPME